MPNAYQSFKVLIGMEIHVQLNTRSKMFTSAVNGFGHEPNTQVDPVVLGLPGTLPVMNKKAVELSILAGLALGCKIAPFTKWDRKSYYYPDLPKNYQISQYDLPLCGEGIFNIPTDNGVKPIRIRRAHLEEDAGKLMHDAPGGFPIDYTIVDLNRAGTPLLEIVTEPDFVNGKEIAAFGQELQKIVQFLGISLGQMQMGHMRFEPNINLHITDAAGQVHKTAITEIKNLNSFSVLERASEYEIKRQLHEWVETGSLGKKSTYGWDEAHERTVHQRDKEEAHDYRYFPDPDLLPVVVDEKWLAELRTHLGELPAARKSRYITTLNLSEKEVATLTTDKQTGDLFDTLLKSGAEPKRAINLIEALRQWLGESQKPLSDLPFSPARLAEIAALAQHGKIAASKETTQKILASLAEKDQPAEQAAQQLGLIQSNDTSAIDAAIDALIASNPKPVQDYKAGKLQALGSLVGMIMKSAKGLNPAIVKDRLIEKLK